MEKAPITSEEDSMETGPKSFEVIFEPREVKRLVLRDLEASVTVVRNVRREDVLVRISGTNEKELNNIYPQAVNGTLEVRNLLGRESSIKGTTVQNVGTSFKVGNVSFNTGRVNAPNISHADTMVDGKSIVKGDTAIRIEIPEVLGQIPVSIDNVAHVDRRVMNK